MRRKDSWAPLDGAISTSKSIVDDYTCGLHPTDEVTYYREIAKHATSKADAQAEINDRDGVPE